MALRTVTQYDVEHGKIRSVGLAGQGPALEAFIRLVERKRFLLTFPRDRIAGWVPGLTEQGSAVAPEKVFEWPIFPDAASLFAANPDISMAIDLSPDGRHMGELRAAASVKVSLIESETLLHCCAAVEDGRVTFLASKKVRKSPSLFALLLDQIENDVLILDDKGVILELNRHVLDSCGLSKEQLLGRSCADIYALSRSCCEDFAECPFEKARITGREAQHTFSRIMPDGRARYGRAWCFPVAGCSDGPAQFLLVRHDVTEQVVLEQRLQEAEKMAFIGELSTYMAHEIRNPLVSIGGFANALLRSSSLDEPAQEAARTIYGESRRLESILANILSFARPMQQKRGVFDVADIARQTMNLMTLGSEERNITVQTEIEPQLPVVSGNAENLKQCLVNLVKNAMESMPDGGGIILRARRTNGFVELEVIDTGEGIPLDLQRQVFSPFYTTKKDGAGLGLAMTRKLIEGMGGKIALESRPGSGTHMTLSLPVALAVDENDEEES